MSGVGAWGKREGCCAQAEILVSDLHFVSIGSRHERDEVCDDCSQRIYKHMTLQSFIDLKKKMLTPIELVKVEHS